MQFTVTPWNGEPGFLCLPRAENIPEPGEGWEEVLCPKCGDPCYMSPDARAVLEENQDRMKGLCTACALRSGFSQGR